MTKQDKVAKVMHEWKAGTLTSNGKQVTDYDQAVAIALSEAKLSKYATGGGIEEEVPLRADIDGDIYEVIGVNHKLNKVRAKNFSSGKVIEMPIDNWYKESFEFGTQAKFKANGREYVGMVTMKDGQKSISLYNDENYSGDAERIVPFYKIDLKTLKPTMKKEMFDKGGEFEDADDFIENVKEMHESIDYVVLKDGTKVNGYDLMEKGGDMNEYSKGGNVIERRYVNKDEDYEVRYAKDKPSRMGYKDERKFAVGGEIGNTVSFKGDYGTPRSGVVKEKRGSSYIVSTDDGDRLVDSYEVISFSETPIAKKKRFGFFEGGGEIENKIEKLKKVVSSKMLPESVKAKAQAEIDKLEKQLHADSVLKKSETYHEEGKDVYGDSFYQWHNISFEGDEDVFAYSTPKGTVIYGEDSEGEKDFNTSFTTEPYYLEEAPEEDYSFNTLKESKVKALELLKTKKLGRDSKELHESKETKAEEKEEHKAGLWKDKKEKIKVGDFVSFDGGYEGIVVAIRNNIHDLKFRLASGEYVDKRRTKSQLSPSNLSVVTNDMKEAVEHLLHESKETKAEEKAEDYIEAKTKALEKSLKDKTISETQRKRDEKELALFKGAEAKKPTTRKFGNITFTIDSAELENGGNVYGGHIDIYNRVIKGFPYNYKTAKEVEERMKSYIKEIKSVTYNGSKGRESQKLPYLVIFNDGQAEIKEKFETAKEALNFQKVLDSIVNSNTTKKPTTRKAPVRKAIVKKAVAKKVVKGDLPKSKFEKGDKVGVSGHNEVYEIKDKSYRNNIEGELTWVYYLPEYSSVLVSEKNLKVIPKPKADHKKLVAKLKAKKGDKEYDNRASLVPFTDKRRERSESSDKKRSALPPGKRVSEDGNVYYESRLNRTDLSKEDKFKTGGEIKGSDWGLNLNW